VLKEIFEGFELRRYWSRGIQAGAGLLGVSGVAVTAASSVQPGGDHVSTYLGALATFLAFLAHRNLAMKDVRRVVAEAVAVEVRVALEGHEKRCRFMAVDTMAKTNPPTGGSRGAGT